MNKQNGEGNTEIPEVEEEVVIDEDETADEKAERLEASNKQLYARAKKAEGFEQDTDGKWIKKPAPVVEKKDISTTDKKSAKDGLTPADMFTLIKSGVEEEDIEEIAEYAKFKKISIAEALVDSVVKTIIADRVEARKVADGTSTGNEKRGNAKVSDEALMSNAKKGIMPESDDDMRRLAKLQLNKNR